MNNLPDINNIDSLVKAVGDIEVLGGISRSGTVDINGDFEPDRYIEQMRDYVSDFAIRKCVELMFSNTHYVNGLDGFITHMSAEQLIIEYADGATRTFKLVDE